VKVDKDPEDAKQNVQISQKPANIQPLDPEIFKLTYIPDKHAS
jgi:hypothetical protein